MPFAKTTGNSNERLARVENSVLTEYGFFMMSGDGKPIQEPGPGFAARPLQLCTAYEDTLYFHSYPDMQDVTVIVETWRSQPPLEALNEVSDEEQTVTAVFSSNSVSIGAFGDDISGIPLARPGRQKILVRCNGREEARQQYFADPAVQLDGVEAWVIRLWPSGD
ncbi:hypothetical protein [Herbihabitans rhizosphaerae]|uniref:hypothetical protein n=1 Tax=Herbihabitans rhizosphaerae TaxID=1872711 RepID=UPI00102D266F|nr:hypothetical protein [Herbihabitans rhizosphaerae]